MAPLSKTPSGARSGQGILLLGCESQFLASPMAARVQQPADYVQRRASMTTREVEL